MKSQSATKTVMRRSFLNRISVPLVSVAPRRRPPACFRMHADNVTSSPSSYRCADNTVSGFGKRFLDRLDLPFGTVSLLDIALSVTAIGTIFKATSIPAAACGSAT